MFLFITPYTKEMCVLTQELLKEFLKYYPETGIFIWNVQKGQRIKAGDIAGTPQNRGSIVIKINGKQYLAHRLAWLYTHGEFPSRLIDHLDGDPSNNRLNNIRECTNSENLKNQSVSKRNTSGFKGVTFHKLSGKWQAGARLNGKRIHLGLYNTPEEASKVYNDFAKEHHGKFYRDTQLNYDNKSKTQTNP